MMRVICHNDNNIERKYAIDTLSHTLLGIADDAYEIVFEESANSYIIEINNNRIVINDHFFRYYPEPFSYLNEQNIPIGLKYFHALGKEIPIIYGEDIFEMEGETTIGLDIFASSFFMLTRWEESLLGREEKGDCDETQLFAVKYGIYNRPVVNEYADILRTLLLSNIGLSNRKYKVILSHDVDGFVPPSWKRIVRDFVKQTVHGAPKNKVLNLTWKEKLKYKLAYPKAYSQFEMYTALTERHHILEWFYFKVCGKGEKEATYLFNDKQVKEVVDTLKKKNNNFILGFHPSQNMFGDLYQWDKEVLRISELLQEKPTIGRNHHLLFNYETLRLWEGISDATLHISNCVFHKRQGFRSGVCVPYHLFDIYQRRVMNLVEHPCQIMDTVIRYDEKAKSEDERWGDILSCIEQVRKFQGELVLTWHIYIREKKLIQEYYQWCRKVVQYAVQ